VHTAEVLRNALALAKGTNANLDVVIAAAICHDYCKIYEYQRAKQALPLMTPLPPIEKTWYRYNIRHVAGSFWVVHGRS
jgi:HD superfamily phosphohydrolase YqeK